ncbi:phage major tail tube protein [Piscirickettsia litoralis]|uniref:Phage major tail tube protein n=1 Tax=Piscirickettsia litoralis TaxID=1891921 RepID=A0ABX2ZY65_9GAMM|nr:phage major tail tube protein [Piscirickettsia litoralis]ODN41547.1 phage major tail tube protein [Piscirickettsia litoralis]
MATALPKVLKNFHLFLDGESWAGLATEVTLPSFEINTEDHRAGGMDSSVPIDLGMEKMEAAFTLNEFVPKTFKMFGKWDTLLRFKGTLSGPNGAQSMEVVMRGLIKKVDPGSIKSGEVSELKGDITLTYCKVSINNEDLIEVDVLNMIRKIDGVDQLEEQRNHLGL